jgi:hypothetical protein
MTTRKQHGRWLAALALTASLSMASVVSAFPSSIYEGQRQQAQQQDDNPYTGPSDSMLNSKIQLYNHEYPPNLRQQREDQYDRDLWRLYLQNHWNDRR